MEKGITSFYGYAIPIADRFNAIKQQGFSHVMMDASPKFIHQNGTLSNQVKLAKQAGLKLSSLHASYGKHFNEVFWKEGKAGEHSKKTLIKELKTCKKFGFRCLVTHFVGEISDIGIKRIRDILKVARRLNKPIAFENLENADFFENLLDIIQDEYFNVCIDVGHINLFDTKSNIFTKYARRIIAFHLHNNNGLQDLHTIKAIAKIEGIQHTNGEGDIAFVKRFTDWNKIAQHIADNNINIPLDYELNNNVATRGNYEPGWILKNCYEEACELENKINNFKKENYERKRT